MPPATATGTGFGLWWHGATTATAPSKTICPKTQPMPRELEGSALMAVVGLCLGFMKEVNLHGACESYPPLLM